MREAPSSSTRNGLTASVVRPWWKPTLGVAFAFSFGLWLGGTLSLTDVLSAAALIGGAIGMGTALARQACRRMREKRLQAWRARHGYDDGFDDNDAEDEFDDDYDDER